MSSFSPLPLKIQFDDFTTVDLNGNNVVPPHGLQQHLSQSQSQSQSRQKPSSSKVDPLPQYRLDLKDSNDSSFVHKDDEMHSPYFLANNGPYEQHTPLFGIPLSHPIGGGKHKASSSLELPSSSFDAKRKQRHRGKKVHPSDDPNHWQSKPIFKTMISGVGFMCDAYDLFVISLILVLLSFEYNESSGDKTLITTSALVGSIVGQISFGIIADYLGRKKSFVATLSLVITGAILSAVAFQSGSFRVFYCLAITQIILGIGIGGEYPLSATVTGEATTEPKGRGRRIATVFSMQSIGAILAPTVVVLTLLATTQISIVWRFCLGFAAIPALCLLYFRITMKESESFIKAHGAEMSMKDAHGHKWRDIKEYKWKLAGTAGSWFIFDLVFYANSLFSSTILEHFYQHPADGAPSSDVHTYLLNISLSTLYISLISLPGYIVATLLIDVVGRRKLQLIGFSGMIIMYIICGAAMDKLLEMKQLFYVLYGLSFFCAQGANVVTFVLPAELFPTTIRATCHGTSAACGKLGAVVGGAMMPAILNSLNLSSVMYVSAGISALGAVWTYFLTWETMNQPLPQSGKHVEKYPRPQHEIDEIRRRIAAEKAELEAEAARDEELSRGVEKSLLQDEMQLQQILNGHRDNNQDNLSNQSNYLRPSQDGSFHHTPASNSSASSASNDKSQRQKHAENNNDTGHPWSASDAPV